MGKGNASITVVYTKNFFVMKKIMNICAAAFGAALLFAACEKDNNSENNNQNKPDESTELEIPETMFFGYYLGDYNEAGTDNVIINLMKGEISYDDDDNYIGNGEICSLDINIEALAEQYDKDHATLPCGTYTVDTEGTYAAGTINAEDSYVLKVVDDVVLMDEIAVKSGTVTISEVLSKSAAPAAKISTRKISVDLVLSDDTPYSFEYEGYAALSNSTEESLFTNLVADVTVGDLCVASMGNMGNLDDTGKTETWVISLGDKYYDIETDYGYGESMFLYLNLEPGLEALPSGHFDKFVDLYDENLTELEPNTLVCGITFYGMYAGCWYTCPARTLESSMVGGSLDIESSDENSDGIFEYKISGSLEDAYGVKVNFSYTGEIEKMVYDTEEYSLKSASSNKLYGRKSPVRMK